MPNEDDDRVVYEAFCPNCGEERAVIRTVPWQEDACVECGAGVDAP